MKKEKPSWKRMITIGILILISLWLFSLMINVFQDETGNIALIKINGVISVEKIGYGIAGTTSTEVIELLKEADEDSSIKAILIEVNSPGGTAVASYEIADAISKVNKTTVAVIREMGLSGGYWVSSSTDYIVANPLSMIGSVGVISSYLGFSGFLENYNVTYERLVAGKYKDIGSPLREMTSEERQIFQNNLDEIQNIFIDSIKENRNLDQASINEVSTAKFYLGKQALELGLVDELGTKEDAIKYIEEKEDIDADIVEYYHKRGFFDNLAGVFSSPSIDLNSGVRV